MLQVTDAPGRLLSAWEAMVRQVEGGYSENIYEYTNDLSPRTFCERRIEDLSDEQREWLARLDARFMASTVGTVRPTHNSDGWWWSRLPRELSGELLADAQALDLLEPQVE